LEAIIVKDQKNEDDHPQTITKSAFSFVSGTFLSRIGGLARDMSMAFCFGTDPAIAAFLVAFRLANLLRRIFGEGALLNGFIPHFESCRNINPRKAAQFFRDTFFSLMFVLILLIGLTEIGLYSWLRWGDISEGNYQIVMLTMIMLPGLLFICLFSICSGLLQCEKSFFLTGSAPVAFNIVWIGAVWILKDYIPQKAVVGLSVAITLAFLFQWAITFPQTFSFLKRYLSLREFFRFDFFSPEIREMLASMTMSVIGVGAVQINSAIDTVFARYASLEGPAYLNYAIHLHQLPLALFGIGIASALLPPLSRAIHAEDMARYKNLLYFALTNALLLLLPCSMAIFALGGASVNLIFGRGDFNNESTMQTTLCLWGYGVGLVPMGFSLLLAPAFYAKKDYWTPTLASLLSILVNGFLNALLVVLLGLGAASLALATSIAAGCNAWFLFHRIAKRTGISLFYPLASFSIKIMVCAGLSGLGTLLVEHFLFQGSTLSLLFDGFEGHFSRHLADQITQFFTLMSTFVVTFFIGAKVCDLREFFQMLRLKPHLPSAL
jgi:putative peptidoglycan lipid II flippase